MRIAAAVNDFASINIDSELVSKDAQSMGSSDGVIPLTNGCMCCTISSDFEGAVFKLLQVGKMPILWLIPFFRIDIDMNCIHRHTIFF